MDGAPMGSVLAGTFMGDENSGITVDYPELYPPILAYIPPPQLSLAQNLYPQ
jgi:hypothetical protein